MCLSNSSILIVHVQRSYIFYYQELHGDVRSRIEQQCDRLVADITRLLQQQRDTAITSLDVARDKALQQTDAFLTKSDAWTSKVEKLSASCHELSKVKHSRDTLGKAKEVAPLVAQLKTYQNE